MKYLFKTKIAYVLFIVMSLNLLWSCNDEDDNGNTLPPDEIEETLTAQEKEGLLFMLEEEKLARDTYNYLFGIWEENTFENIRNSEQNHMNAVESLLIDYEVSYTILPEGQFDDEELQNLYNQFEIDGELSLVNALIIGSTIEDLDIRDLQLFINEASNTGLINVYDFLFCGSRNHMRGFTNKLNQNGTSYTPQFITLEEYNDILNAEHENCNL